MCQFGANRSIRLAAFPDFNLWPLTPPPKCPCDIEERIVFSYVNSQTNPQAGTKFDVNRSSNLTASPDIWICDPLKPSKMPPWVIVGWLYLAYVHFQMNPQTWTKVGANRPSRLIASPDLWKFDLKRMTRLQPNAHKHDNIWLVTTLYSYCPYIYSLDCQGAVRLFMCDERPSVYWKQ